MFSNNYLYFTKNIKNLKNKINITYSNKLFFREVEIIFKLSSNINNKIKFIIMLSLMEKLLNNQLIFLMDRHTLSNKKTIKIGYISNINGKKLFNFIKLCYLYSIPKVLNGTLFYDFINSSKIQYSNKKILYNLMFNVDKNINFYYDYLNDFDYDITFCFKTLISNIIFNKLLLNFYKFDFFLFDNMLIQNILNNTYITNINNIEKDDLFFVENENIFDTLGHVNIIYGMEYLFTNTLNFKIINKNVYNEYIDNLLLNYVFMDDIINSYNIYKIL